MSETGVVKFAYECDFRELAPFPGLEEANAARQELRALGLLGVGEDGVGFGNVSLRNGWTNSFYITGSGTGALCSLGLRDYARVVAWDFARNWLRSEGCAIPSAESLTHAAIYAADPNVRAVVHGHDAELWHRLLESGPFTAADVPYGTPEMAREVERLFRTTNVGSKKCFAMAGHQDGVIAFGNDFREALDALRRFRKRTPGTEA